MPEHKTLEQRAGILLTGLPGSGKKRIRRALCEIMPNVTLRIVPDEIEAAEAANRGVIWCVVDARADFESERDAVALKCLSELLASAQGVVLNFCEAADLTQQSRWVQWIKLHQPQLPLVRVTQGRFPQAWQGFTQLCSAAAMQTQQAGFKPVCLQTMQTHRFEVKRLYLQHLLMGLDAFKRNWSLPIWRVRGVFETFEYVNRVAIEGTPFGVDTYAADEAQACGWLEISGLELPEQRLRELVDACQLHF